MNETPSSILRWYMAAGYAASEVGALIAIGTLISVLSGWKDLWVLIDFIVLLGLGAWLWLRKSRIAAGLLLIVVAAEIGQKLVASSGSNLWLSTFAVLFLVALAAHGRKPKTPKPEPMMGLRVWAVIVGIVGMAGILATFYEVAFEHNFARIIWTVLGVWIWAPLTIQAIRRQGLSPRWFWVTVGIVGGSLALIPIWHHGREWKSTWRKVVGWLFFMAVIAYFVGVFVWAFLQGMQGA